MINSAPLTPFSHRFPSLTTPSLFFDHQPRLYGKRRFLPCPQLSSGVFICTSAAACWLSSSSCVLLEKGCLAFCDVCVCAGTPHQHRLGHSMVHLIPSQTAPISMLPHSVPDIPRLTMVLVWNGPVGRAVSLSPEQLQVALAPPP